MKNIKYPIYYNVDDIPVIIAEYGHEVYGQCANGRPYPIGKAIVDGFEISEGEYKKLQQNIYLPKYILNNYVQKVSIPFFYEK